MEKQKKLLAVMVGMLILAGGYAVWDYPSQREAPDNPGPGKQEKRLSSRSSRPALRQENYRIRFDWEAPGGDFRGARQDLFGPLKERPPAPLPSSGQENAVSQAPERRSLIRDTGPSFTYLGYLQAHGEKRFFVRYENIVYVAREGEPFGENKEFVLHGGDAEALQIRKKGSATLETVPLSASPPLSASSAAASPGAPNPTGSAPGEKESLPEGVPETSHQKTEIQQNGSSGPGAAVPPDDWILGEKR